MTKNRRILTFGVAALVFALAARFIWPTPYRDFALRPGNFRVGYAAVLAARQHRLTGSIDVLTRSGWHPLAGPADTLRALAADSLATP